MIQFKRSEAASSQLRVGLFLLAGLGLSVVWATPPVGFYVNQILAMGATDGINQQVQFDHDPKRKDDEPWHAQVHAHGVTDFYVQRLGLLPGGYSGWHTHPGLLIGTVVSGSIDFFDADCRKVTYTTGQVFQENNKAHAIINNGAQAAELAIVYLIKHGEGRRIEADAPSCAPSTSIP